MLISIINTHGYHASEAQGGDEVAANRGRTAGFRRARYRARIAGRGRANGGVYQGSHLPAVSFEERVSARPVRAVRRRRAGGGGGAPGLLVRAAHAAIRGTRDARSPAAAPVRGGAGGVAGRRDARRATPQGCGAPAPSRSAADAVAAWREPGMIHRVTDFIPARRAPPTIT